MFERVEQSVFTRERCAQLLDDFRIDLHYAWRQLRRAPAFAALVVATLAIGIGANATMAGVIDKLLFRAPPALPDAGSLVRFVGVSKSAAGGISAGGNYDYPLYLDFKQGIRGLQGVAGFTSMGQMGFASDDPSSELTATATTPDFFEVLGVHPVAGSFFGSKSGLPATASSGGPAFAVLGYAFWQRQFNGSRAIIGAPIQIGKISYTVIGVAPENFRGVETTPVDAWIPINVALEVESPQLVLAMRGLGYLQIFGRLAPGASREAIGAQASAINLPNSVVPGAVDQHPRVVAAPIVRGRGPDAPREVQLTLWLGGVSALVLLIVSANVANLLLGRAFTRRREIAVRLALGAGRGRLARQLMTEALLMSALGGAIGLYLAAFGSQALQRLFATDISGDSLIDVRLFAFTAIVALSTGALVSLVPMLQSTTPDLSSGLRASAGASKIGGRSVRTTLLAVQSALCVILLVGAGLFAQSLRRVQALDLGVDLDHTIEATLSGAARLSIPDANALQIVDDIKTKVAAIPGVGSVALARAAFAGGRAVSAFRKGHVPGSLRAGDEVTYMNPIDSGMFRTLGARSLRGREFGSQDRRGTPLVTIINEPLAQKLFPGEDAIGQCIVLATNASKIDGDCVEIVGVLKGFNRQSILTRDALVAYVPLAQDRERSAVVSLYVRTHGDAAQSIDAVRRAVLQVRPDLRRLKVRTMREVIDPQMRPWNLAAGMFMLFGAVALIIAMIGLYAVVSFSVAQRTSEIAVRLALGARTSDVAAAVGNSGIAAVTGGLAFGVIVALFMRRWIGPLLFQTSPSDPFVIGGVALLLLCVAIVAMLVPLARALRVNPAQVLREV